MKRFAGSSRQRSGWTVVLLALSSWTVVTQADDGQPTVAPFPEATVITGTARERGETYGRKFSQAIREFYASEIQQPFVGHPATQQELLDGFPGMPFGAGMNEHGIALCWTSAALEIQGASPRVGVPSYVLIAHLLAQPDLDSVIRVASRDRHAGWFTFVMADGQGNLVNIEGSPHGVAIERSTTSVVRVGYGIPQMQDRFSTGTPARHPRCEKMCRLLERSPGRTSQDMLQDYFSDPMCEISVAKSTIDMMIFNTTARTAILSRSPDYGTAWQEFRFAFEPKAD